MDNIRVFDGCKHPIKHLKNDNVFIVLTQEEKEQLFNEGGGSGTSVTVDSVLSKTSTNPVQNKVLYTILQKIQEDISTLYERIDSPKEDDEDSSSVINNTVSLNGVVTHGVLVVNSRVNNKTLIL